jgi:hypothetical protein
VDKYAFIAFFSAQKYILKALFSLGLTEAILQDVCGKMRKNQYSKINICTS